MKICKEKFKKYKKTIETLRRKLNAPESCIILIGIRCRGIMSRAKKPLQTKFFKQNISTSLVLQSLIELELEVSTNFWIMIT